MKFFFLILLLSSSAFASKIRDSIQSYGEKSDEIVVRLSATDRVIRIPEGSAAQPCLRNAWMARKPVDILVNDETGKILDCQLAPKPLPGKRGY